MKNYWLKDHYPLAFLPSKEGSLIFSSSKTEVIFVLGDGATLIGYPMDWVLEQIDVGRMSISYQGATIDVATKIKISLTDLGYEYFKELNG